MDANQAKFDIALFRVTQLYLAVATCEVALALYGVWRELPMQTAGLLIVAVVSYVSCIQQAFDSISERIAELRRIGGK